MSEKEDSVLDAPHKPSQRVTRKSSKEAKESCSACGIAISTHLGKAGQGTCFGTEVTKVFSDLLTLVGSVKAELEEERHEARDREARLTRKVSELCKMLAAAETRESDALTKLTTVEKTVQTLTKQVQQLQQEAKKGREGESRSSRTEHEGTTETEEDHKNSKEQTRPWADVCRGAEVNESESESNESQRPSSPMSSTSKEKHGQETRITNSTKDTMDTKDTKDTKRTRTVRPKPKIDPLDSEDESWNLVVEKKPTPPKAVLYVGNLSPQTTTERLEKFISERMKSVGAETPRIFNSRMHANRKDENGSVIGARITVPTDAVPTLTSRSFWPRPAYARRWNFTPPAKPANLEETDYKHDPASNPTDPNVSVDAYERADPEVSSGTQSTPAPDSLSP